MFVPLIAFLSIIQVIFAEDATQSTVLAANIYDDVMLEKILHSLDLLQTTNDNLRLRIDSLNFIMLEQFIKQQNEFKKELDQQFTKQQNDFKKDLDQQQIQFKEDIDQQFAKQQNDCKKNLDQQEMKLEKDVIQQFIKHQNEFKKDIERQQIEFKEDMDHQFTKQQSELQKGFEDLKLAFTDSKETLTSVNSKDANLTDITGDFTNQHQKIYQNKSNTTTQSLLANCVEAVEKNGRSGIYSIKIQKSELEPFDVYCLSHVGSEMENNTEAVNSSNAAWLVIQRRQDGSVDFYRNWTEYQHGFGDLKGEFFIGLDKLHELTQSASHELWIQMEDFEGNKRWAKYSSFAIGGQNESYILNDVGAYTGDASDSLSLHVGRKWTTKDVDNDTSIKSNCAILYRGAWWYDACYASHLNGEYLRGMAAKETKGSGIVWGHSLKYVHMAIRPVSKNSYNI